MIPIIPTMTDASIQGYAAARQLPIVVDVGVPLYDVTEGPEGYSTARPIGYAMTPDAIHVHPERLVEYHLRTLACAIIVAMAAGWRSSKTA